MLFRGIQLVANTFRTVQPFERFWMPNGGLISSNGGRWDVYFAHVASAYVWNECNPQTAFRM